MDRLHTLTLTHTHTLTHTLTVFCPPACPRTLSLDLVNLLSNIYKLR